MLLLLELKSKLINLGKLKIFMLREFKLHGKMHQMASYFVTTMKQRDSMFQILRTQPLIICQAVIPHQAKQAYQKAMSLYCVVVGKF